MKLVFLVLLCALHLISALEQLYPPQNPSSRIVGGEDAKDGAAPHQCSLKLLGQHICGCAIISNEWIITASHCRIVPIPSLFRVVVGTNDVKNGGDRYEVQKFIRHEGYNKPKFANDIALIRLKGPLQFNEKVQPIELLTNEVPDGAQLQLTGWGALRANGAAAQRLQIINLNAVTTERCRSIYEGEDVEVHDSHICTLTKAGEGACNGDSGGPLVFGGKLVGIVNWGVPCALGYPDAYAKISYLYGWVQDQIRSS